MRYAAHVRRARRWLLDSAARFGSNPGGGASDVHRTTRSTTSDFRRTTRSEGIIVV